MKQRGVVHVSTFAPARCGIAEYTESLAAAMVAAAPELRAQYLQLDPTSPAFAAGADRITLNPDDPSQFDLASDFLNAQEDIVIMLQHEFKLYGGIDGKDVCRLLERVRAPIITTLHTVRPEFPRARRHVIEALATHSRALIVFTSLAARILRECHAIDERKIVVIPHGVPEIPFVDPESVVRMQERGSHLTFITAGLIRPTKGIEAAVTAFGNIRHRLGSFSYVVCGTNHPRNSEAATYRDRVLELVHRNGLQSNVVFIDRYVTREELVARIQASDAGILTYTAAEQSSSGVLALLMACGRPVITTDFQAARALVSEQNGIVVPMDDPRALECAILAVARDHSLRREMMTNNYKVTRQWTWPAVARSHVEVVQRAL